MFHLTPFFELSAPAKDVLASVLGIAAWRDGGLLRARVRVGVGAGARGAGGTPEAGAFASVIATNQKPGLLGLRSLVTGVIESHSC